MSADTLRKIKAGLAARPGTNTGNYVSLDSVVGAPFTFADLNRRTINILTGRDNLKKRAENFANAMKAFEAKTWAELSETGKTREAGPNGTFIVQDLWGDDRREIELTKRVNAYRKNLAAEGEAGRIEAIKGFRANLEKLAAARDAWSDPAVMLDRQTVGESARRIYRENLEHSRPKAVENALKSAVAEGNRAKVAACLDVLDNMATEDADQVRVSRAEAAAYVLGEEYVKACQHMAAVELAELEADKAIAQIAGKSTADINKRIGLKRRHLRELHGEDVDLSTVEDETAEGGTNDAE